MLLNTSIFNTVVETAKVKSATNPAMLRAIDRAVRELNRSKYWAYDAQTNVLKLMSTTSKKLYIIDDAHTCDARSKQCKHMVSRKLLLRYSQACSASAIEKETKQAVSWNAATGHTTVAIPRVKIIPLQTNAANAPLVAPSLYLRGEKYAGVDI